MTTGRFALLAALLTAGLTVPASAAVPPGPKGMSFYSPPAAKVAAGPHGSVIWARAVQSAKLPSEGRSWLVLYRSVSPQGDIVPVSGVVTLPKGKAPKSGWPVISWAHGTTGIADVCAPTRMLGGKPDSYGKSLRSQMNEWLDDGFAVAQTDYQGLGTPGLHPYLIGVSEGRSVVDIVSAARRLNPHVGKRWIAIGHSQGGHAVLWAASLAAEYAPTLRLAGAVPLAPANHIGEQAQLIDSLDTNPYGGLPPLILAAAVQSAGLEIETVFSTRALALYPGIDRVCEAGLTKDWGPIAIRDMLNPDFDRTPLLAVLSANDPEDLTIRVAVLMAQGKSDTTVLPGLTDETVKSLRSRGTKVTYKTYAGVGHSGIPKAARTAADVFIHERLEG